MREPLMNRRIRLIIEMGDRKQIERSIKAREKSETKTRRETEGSRQYTEGQGTWLHA